MRILIYFEKRKTNMWTWQRLLQRCNFSSCEVLLIDAEGYDAKILRSVVKHCRSHPGSWPDLIQFESMGHADSIEGKGAEWGAIELLKTLVLTATKIKDGKHLISVLLKSKVIDTMLQMIRRYPFACVSHQ